MKCSKCGKEMRKDICFAARMEHLVLLMKYRSISKCEKSRWFCGGDEIKTES